MTPRQFSTVSVAAILAESASRRPDSIALVLDGSQLSYGELWRQTRRYAGALREQGIGPGDAVAVLIPNVFDFVRVYYAVLALGAIVVPIHALLKASEISFVLSDSHARLLICAEPLFGQGAEGARTADVPVLTVLSPDERTPRLEAVAEVAAPIDDYVPRAPDDTATILYTSGTTGRPKGSMGSHFALVEQTSVLLTDTFDLAADDVIFGGLPLFHTFGQTCALNTVFRAGARAVLVPRFEGDSALQTMIDQGCTIMMGVPTMYIALLETAKKTRGRPPLRYGLSGGAPIPLAVIERFRSEFGAEIYEGYGLTETSPVASFNHRGRPPVPGSIGTPIWGVDIEIADADVDDKVILLPRGELGELVIRGHNLMKGYLNLPEETARAVVDGWFRSGDLGTKDDDGYLRIVDRKKDMILRNGYNVYPREIEEVLAGHPAVVSAAVFGVPHETQGQEVVACVVLSPDPEVTDVELVDYTRERVASYKYPRRVVVVDALPLGPSGKVLKRELSTRYADNGH